MVAISAVGLAAGSAGSPGASAANRQAPGWVQQAAIEPAVPVSTLSSVSCASATWCTAVGLSPAGPLVEAWNGEDWRTQLLPSGVSYQSLSGVSCRSPTSCTAVGSQSSGGSLAPLALHWNGASWIVEPAPTPAGATSSALQAVACASSTACTAVGYVDSEGTELTLAEACNGARWSIEPTPRPLGSIPVSLDAVACSSATACTAVGPLQVVERWTGRAWLVETTPSLDATHATFEAVSCPAIHTCVVVGHEINPARREAPLAEVWNGTTWKLDTTPTPAGASRALLSGVSCTSPSTCTAVGDFMNSAKELLTLSEHWNGTSWAAQATPNPPAPANHLRLFSVSCIRGALCDAVGSYLDALDHSEALAAAWAGPAWKLQAPTNGEQTTDSALNSGSARPIPVASLSEASSLRPTSARAWSRNGTARSGPCCRRHRSPTPRRAR